MTCQIETSGGGYAEPGRERQHRSGRSIDALAVLVRNIVAVVGVWRARSRFRRELAARSEYELQDMGTCWSSIAHEVSKPFWRA